MSSISHNALLTCPRPKSECASWIPFQGLWESVDVEKVTTSLGERGVGADAKKHEGGRQKPVQNAQKWFLRRNHLEPAKRTHCQSHCSLDLEDVGSVRWLYHVGNVGARHLQHGRIGYGLGSFLSYGSALWQELLHDLGGGKPLMAAGDKIWTLLFW